MTDIQVIYNIAKKIIEENNFSKEEIPPIFSFEGLPGAGKTTQIKQASKELKNKYGKSYYIDLPTDSSIGLVLKAIYTNKHQWKKIQSKEPWLNPFLLSVDFKLALEKAKQRNARYVLMSRGILSTYYYNYKAYLNMYKDFDIVWEELTNILTGFTKPTAILFFEIPAELANKRVLIRNREKLREMDKVENMKRDRELLNIYIKRIKQSIPIHYIDASSEKDRVTQQIDDILGKYLKVRND